MKGAHSDGYPDRHCDDPLNTHNVCVPGAYGVCVTCPIAALVPETRSVVTGLVLNIAPEVMRTMTIVSGSMPRRYNQ